MGDGSARTKGRKVYRSRADLSFASTLKIALNLRRGRSSHGGSLRIVQTDDAMVDERTPTSFKGQLIRTCQWPDSVLLGVQNMHTLQLPNGAVRIKTRGCKRGCS